MSYLQLSDYPKQWIFNHQSLPISEEDKAQIKPMTAQRSAMFWRDNISKTSPDVDRLAPKDWPTIEDNWQQKINWQKAWESDESNLPNEILEFINWQEDVTVYFCYEKYNVVETNWKIFKKHWKNFLFFDDGPILIARRRNEALWFQTSGMVFLGNKDK